MTTVFLGTVLLAFFGGSDESNRASYDRWNAEGQLMVELGSWAEDGTQSVYPIGPEAATILTTQLGAGEASVLSGVRSGSTGPTDTTAHPTVALRPEVNCELQSGSNPAGACNAPFRLFSTGSTPQIWTGNLDDLALILDDDVSSQAQRTLEAGGAVSLYPEYAQDDGTIQIQWLPASAATDAGGAADVMAISTTAVAAVVQEPAHPIHFSVFMLDSTATSLGMESVPYRVLASFATAPDAAAVALGLARADGRRDDVTLSAVGANPGLRRSVGFWQAMLLTGTGTVLGGALGLLGPGMLGLVDLMAFAPPWPQLLLLVVGLPLVIAVGSWLLTRPAQFDERLQRTLA